MHLYIQYNAFDVIPYCFPHIFIPIKDLFIFLLNMFIIHELTLHQTLQFWLQ
jgi:hypothetical protein